MTTPVSPRFRGKHNIMKTGYSIFIVHFSSTVLRAYVFVVLTIRHQFHHKSDWGPDNEVKRTNYYSKFVENRRNTGLPVNNNQLIYYTRCENNIIDSLFERRHI